MGSGGHLAGTLFLQLAGVSALHVPYKSAGASILSAVQNESQWTFTPIGAPLPRARAGKLRALAVSEDQRAPQIPDVPTTDSRARSSAMATLEVPAATSAIWRTADADVFGPPKFRVLIRRAHPDYSSRLSEPRIPPTLTVGRT
jgi:tripartite-type tricarboxylate transporter receptor subunit TctC